ncbi:MAG: hypothetical protein AB7T74_08135 [Clostridia bacterium]|jgi:hypothetical protein
MSGPATGIWKKLNYKSQNPVLVADVCLPCMADGAVLWFAFPKQSSKTIRSDINRDSVWELLAPRQIHPNRNVAVDDDWSALRFRRA